MGFQRGFQPNSVAFGGNSIPLLVSGCDFLVQVVHKAPREDTCTYMGTVIESCHGIGFFVFCRTGGISAVAEEVDNYGRL